jgi:hypothetical protein
MIKRINNQVQNLKDQIENTLLTLFNEDLVRVKKNVSHQITGHKCKLTWDNHKPGRYNSGQAFTTLNQYIKIYDTGAYHAILHDGSIIRACFNFYKNMLLEESLLFWPSPIDIPEEIIDEYGIYDAIVRYFVSDKINNFLKMRTPVRLDFNHVNNTTSHPATHLHIQHRDCRISVREPCCFNTFVKFIFKNFYPDISNKILNKLHPLKLSSSVKSNINATIIL